MTPISEEALDTPCVIIDTCKMELNIRTMAETARSRGVRLRPHAKTHKMPWVAEKQLLAGAVGITVAKIAEAEAMADHGIADVFVAYPLVTPAKIARAIRLSRRIRLIVGADSLEGARRLSEAAKRSGTELEVRLEVDTGLRRTGAPYEEAAALAQRIHALPGLRLTGIYTFRGALYDGRPTLDVRSAGEEEGRMMAALAQRIRASGIPLADVSVGSTPTAAWAAAAAGVTEIRPGTYVFQDRMTAAFGVCGLDDCAGVVHVTVVSRPAADLAVIDGGSKTFATDVQPNTEPLRLQGFGHVIGLEDAVLERLTEEHGMLRLGTAAQAARLTIGDVLHIVPNHICSTINLHNRVYFRQENGYEERPVLARGMLE